MPLVKCPICKKEVEWEGNAFRPFCSERCKMIDLGEWIEQGYSLPDEGSGLNEDDLREIERALDQNQSDEEHS